MVSKKELLSTVNRINKDHDKILKNIKELKTFCENNQQDEIVEKFEDFDDFIHNNFKLKEKYAKKTAFPQIDQLKKEHEYFKSIYFNARYHPFFFDSFRCKYKNVLILGFHLIKLMEEWFNLHIKFMDNELIDHIRQKAEE